MRSLLASLCVPLLAVGVAAAQGTPVVTHVALVHKSATKASAVLDTLHPGDVVTLLSQKKKNSYYHVQTQKEQTGWVYATYLSTVDPTEAHQPTPASDLQKAPTDVSVASGPYDGCADSGSAKLATVKVLNRLKNRSTEPTVIDPTVTLDALLAPSNDDSQRFDETHAAQITAFVYQVKPGGLSETTNCKKGDPQHRDTHIELVTSPSDTAETRRVIVEVTPRWRAALAARGIDWSTASLQKTIEGRWVTITGWLMFDAEHKGEALNTAPNNGSDWRATVWEIHPITNIEIVNHP